MIVIKKQVLSDLGQKSKKSLIKINNQFFYRFLLIFFHESVVTLFLRFLRRFNVKI
jgi:hypothetical protein